MMTLRVSSSRRDFLRKSAASAFGFTFLPAYLTSARAADNPRLPPSQRINLGCIGVGGRATGVIPSLCRDGKATPVAFCDVDFELPGDIGRNLEAYPDTRRFHDFREMYDQMGDDIDAVSVVTPDHTHFVATIQAMAMGKHVYVEKPLTRTFEESEILMRAEKKYGVVTQMGNQGHTGKGIDTFARMVDLGLCNKLTRMEAWKSPSLWFMNREERLRLPLEQSPAPKSLKSWDLWCGPRAKLPFHELYHPFNWRGFYEYGMGMLGDWGAHIIDFAHDKLEMGLPTNIKSLRMDDHNQAIFPLSSQLSMHFPARGGNRPAIDLTWRDGAECLPQLPEPLMERDKEGNLVAPIDQGVGSILYSEDGEFAVSRGSHGAVPRIVPREQFKKHYDSLKSESSKKPDHFASFINACMGEGTTNSPFSIGGKLTQVLALGVVAQYLDTELTFDPETKRFVGNDEANVLLNPPPRKEWAGYYEIA